MPFIGNQPALSYTSFAKQDFTTSATTSYTLDNPVTNENELALFINFVRQEPTTAYTASGTSLTLTSATSASDDMYAIFLGKALQTVNPPSGSVGTSQLASTLDLSSKTVTLASNMKNTPAFSATRTSNQSATSPNALTKFQGNVENFDTDNAYDNSTNYRFTPQVAGKYLIYAKFYLDSSDVSAAKQAISTIYKNGSLYSSYQLDFRNNYGGYDNSVMNQAIIDMNGSSDYVEAYFQIIVNTGTGLLVSGTKSNEFGGYKIIE